MGSPTLLLGFVPVVLFLLGLMLLDSFKLVRQREVVFSILAGVGAALLAFVVNVGLLHQVDLDPLILRRYVAPFIEEALKAGFVVFLIRKEKVGFMVDAAIHGFAGGTGFALVENFYYAQTLGDTGLAVWIARGLGTAIMHGSMTAIIAIVSKGLTERHESNSLVWFMPGFALAFVLHSAFNHLILNPLLSTAILLVAMPMLLLFVFDQSEKATRDWLGTGLDSDAELLEQILSGEVVTSRVGEYLDSLRERFEPKVVGDMMSLLQIHVELSMRAKGILIARQAGVELGVDDEIRANLKELKYLEDTIGEVGLLALMPLRRTSSQDLWQLTQLEKGGR